MAIKESAAATAGAVVLARILSQWYFRRVGEHIDPSGRIFFWCWVLTVPTLTIWLFIAPNKEPTAIWQEALIGLLVGSIAAGLVWFLVTTVIMVVKVSVSLRRRIQDTRSGLTKR